MEHLNLHDNETPPPQQGGAQMPMQQMPPLGSGMLPPPASQQLPPQMFTTAAQLLDMTDKKLMVALRDGRKLIGVLRSWDQFANLVLQSTIERIFVSPSSTSETGLYADVKRGIFLVRGENVLLLGEIDLDKDDDEPPGYERADVETVHRLQKEQKAKDARREKIVKRRLGELGFEGENAGEALI
ncbi:U6 snRNA-associated Sm-like protein LSm1 [Lachnellula arida]|uniref:U6 snRNA-associated Sm-like protein LSm1 n=1 Tax=Lachnellula arida TaxID=1316785 RepID=A0A8T9BA54_9HELO|nr:U6 snRNA-associated Sm-like protein LSm1 [Lachnellula arida]